MPTHVPEITESQRESPSRTVMACRFQPPSMGGTGLTVVVGAGPGHASGVRANGRRAAAARGRAVRVGPAADHLGQLGQLGDVIDPELQTATLRVLHGRM